ncbi:MAG: hypothetical protein OXQ31_04130 [Spirochaetaceae bacterium]|nr:hypothetical protein [Spirochaetaceae bacterium]
MLAQPLVGAPDDGGGFLRLLQQEDGVHLRSAVGIQPDHGRVGDRRVGLQHLLHVLGIDVAAVGQDDHVLLAALDVEVALRVQEALVAGLVPLSIERARRLLRRLPVALGDVRPAHQDLAVVGDAHVDARHRPAHRVEAGIVQRVGADHRRRLGGAVALQDVDADQVPLLAQRAVQGGAAGDDGPEAAAEAGVDLAEHAPAQPHRQVLGQLLRQLPHPLLAAVDHLPLDALHEQVERLRHQQHHRDPALLHELQQDRRLAAGGEGDVRPEAERREQRAHLLEHVAERQQRQQAQGRVAGDDLEDRLQVGQQVAVGEHHPLGVAGGARGEHDLGQVFAGELDRPRLTQGVALLLQLLEVDRGQPHLLVLRRREARHEGGCRIGPGPHLLGELRRGAHVQRHDDGAGADHAEVGEHPVRGVRPPDDHAVALADAALLQQRRDAAGTLPDVPVAPVQVAEARLERQRRPLLEAARRVL